MHSHHHQPPTPSSPQATSSSHGLRGPRIKRSHSAVPKLSTIKASATSQSWNDPASAKVDGGTPVLSPIAALPEFGGGKTSRRLGHRHSKSLHHANSSRHIPTVASSEAAVTDIGRRIARMRDHHPLSLVSSHHSYKKEPVAPGSTLDNEAVQEKSLEQWAKEEEKERGQTMARNEEIWTVFQSVSDLSMETTKRLDNVYYSMLERLDTLKSTISSLQELANKTKTMGIEFDRDAKNVKVEMQEQLDVFAGFERPKQKIESLESRMKSGKEQTERLSARLQAARERVQLLESQEEEVQASITFQFRLIWAALACVLAIVLAVLLYKTFTSTTTLHKPPPLPSEVSVDEILKTILPSDRTAAEICTKPTSKAASLFTKTQRDPLRIFDEL